MRRAFALVVLLAVPAPARAQDPIHWTARASPKDLRSGGGFAVVIAASVEEEWHVYSVTQGRGGPVPTTIAVGPRGRFSRAGAIRGPEPVTAFDPNFDIKTETYDGSFTLVVPVMLAADAAGNRGDLQIAVRYQACTNRLCLPPTTVSLRLPIRWTRGERAARSEAPDASAEQAASPASSPESVPRPAPPVSFGASASTWGAFIWLAVSMGALSLLTPCVFPMVPITVSYFTNNAAATRRRAVGSAALYGLGIVLTFTLFGSLLAAVAGAAGLNRFAANPWLNLAIAALFVTFALNLFGLYELRLPFRVLSRLDAMSRRRGASVAGALLMAATFTVTSLTCTAAFLGTLLVVAAQGQWQRPVAGLLAYSATFALPFVALAAAPQLISQLPRSGPWLARVKVVMGFLEIVAAMKFFSNADLVWSWGVLTRTVVLLSWILTAVALVIYTIGRRPSAGRVVGASIAAACAVWLATGLSGRRLGELEAFLPPAAALAEARGELPWITDDLDAALAQARASKRAVLIDFTGYTCTNCRWMEANMFPRAEVRDQLERFVRARLYTDGQGAVYERQQRYQQERFKTVALPLYAIVDAEQRTIATFAGLTREPGEFVRFLQAAR